jgi:hypothetical protein
MRRLFLTPALALVALAPIVSSASASTHIPVITSVSPSTVAVGQPLVLNGKNFKKGVKNNRVFFVRASDGKTVRARPLHASSTRRMTVLVPAAITNFLNVVNAVAQPTRFQIYVLSGVFSKKTTKSHSPIIVPAGTTTPGGTPTGPGTTAPPPADCDADGTPDAQDTDDDNDGLPDTLEAKIGTDPCKADTDGDGVSDAYEYYSALDLNSNALPYAGKRPYPNPLDGTDAVKDFDGDGMTMAQEYSAWVYSGKILPAGPGQSFPYSDGNQMSPAGPGPGAMDLDGNGRITDNEKDADSDGLPNWVEMATQETHYSTSSGCAFVSSTGPAPSHYRNAFTSCHGGPIVPNANTFGNTMSAGSTVNDTTVPAWLSTQLLDYLNPDTDGDGIPDALDDNDFDGLSNIEEITAGADGFYTEPQDPCDPNVNAPTCPLHAPA